MSQIKEITQTCIQINPSLRTDVSQLLQNLLSKLQALEKYEEHLEKLNQQNGAYDATHDKSTNANGLQQQISVHSNHSHKSNSSNSSLVVATLSHQNDISEMCSSPLLLAHQLTHIELERLSYIGPEEFVQAFTKEHPSIETSFKDLKKTRNLESYVTWFNRLSYLVATDVIKVINNKIDYYFTTSHIHILLICLFVCLSMFSIRKRNSERKLSSFGLRPLVSHSILEISIA
jgi:RasGEF domain